MKMKFRFATLAILAFSIGVPSAYAQSETLVQVGDFLRDEAEFPPDIKLPESPDGAETYTVDCDQAAGIDGCSDSEGNFWDFGTALDDVHIFICEASAPLANVGGCVHTVEINLKTMERYMDVFVELSRRL